MTILTLAITLNTQDGSAAAMLHELLQAHGGTPIRSAEGSLLASFSSGEPLSIAVQLLQQHSDAISGLALDASNDAGRAQHLLALAKAGELVLTPQVLRRCKLPQGAQLADRGMHVLSVIPEKVFALQIAAQSVPATVYNSPAQTTPFVGRQEELASITAQLSTPSCRLLTLLGPGGMGKTRLALEAARQLAGRYRHGAVFVSLANISVPSQMIFAIADALSFSFYGSADQDVQLLNYLREKQMLLLIDNLEHVVAAAPLIERIIKIAPNVTVLATSRMVLGLEHEQVLPILGLDLPPLESPTIEQSSAVQLFTNSAKRTQPDFQLAAKDRAPVVEICHLLEGQPLGLELIASWARVLSCAEMADELRRGVHQLSTRLRDLPERHQSLQAVFDYSWEILTSDERRAMRKLALFHGSFAEEAARSIAGTTTAMLEMLFNQSLLHGAGPGRYRLHEALRRYIEEQMEQTGAMLAGVQMRYSEYYAQQLVSHADQLRGRQQQAALAALQPDLANIRSAWAWAVEQRHFGLTATMIEPLYQIFELRSALQEALDAFEQLIQQLPLSTADQQLTALRATALAYSGECLARLGRYDEADQLLEQSIELARGAAAQPTLAFALNTRGDVARTMGEYEQAQTLLEEGLTLARSIADTAGMARADNNLGIVVGSQGQVEQATELFREAVERYQQLGDQRGEAKALNNLGIVAYLSGDLERARTLYQQSQALYESLGNRLGIASSLNNLGLIARQLGDPAQATQLQREALRLFGEIGYRLGEAQTLNDLGQIAADEHSVSEAHTYFTQALDTAAAVGATPLVLEVLSNIGALALQEGHTGQAAELLSLVHAHPSSSTEARARAAEQLEKLARPTTLLTPETATERLDEVVGRLLNSHASATLPQREALRG